MFINDVNRKEEIRKIAIQHLRKYGIKYRDKSRRQFVQVSKSKQFFNTPLQNLENEVVTLKNGQQLLIPKQLYEICSFIFTKVETEGIFRKEGSKSRQNEIKLLLNRGCLLEDDHHVIDVAVVLKYFLRELPEPLIPYSYHELFLRCSLVEKKVEALSLACLLLPTEHLNVLSFLMQFLNEVAHYSVYNKMDSNNIAIVMGPNVFPINDKVAPKNKLMVIKICDIIKLRDILKDCTIQKGHRERCIFCHENDISKMRENMKNENVWLTLDYSFESVVLKFNSINMLMIENSRKIGLIPDYIIDQIDNIGTTEVDVVHKTKRRRSGSLTRIFNGLKKMVGNKPDEEVLRNTVTPDLLLTPSIIPVKNNGNQNELKLKQKMRNAAMVIRRDSKAVRERRWSAITQETNFKREKRNSFIDLPRKELFNLKRSVNESKSNTEYVKVSKSEYEAIKSRVSAIEKRLSIELDNVQSTINVTNNNANMELNNIIQNIQSAYEKTLVQTEPLNQGTDNLARRLSKELRIRTDNKMIRSPSARKIGNIRRRSRELDKPNSKISSSDYLQFVGMKKTNSEIMQRISSSVKIDNNGKGKRKKSTEGPIKRIASFNDRYNSPLISRDSSLQISIKSSDPVVEIGTCNKNKSTLSDLGIVANGEFISPCKFNIGIFQNNNILFNSEPRALSYRSPISTENVAASNILSTKEQHNIATKHDDRLLHKFRSLKSKEKVKENVPPLKKHTNMKQKGRNEKLFLQIGPTNKESGMLLQEELSNKSSIEINLLSNSTPKIMPRIKKPVVIKSPRRLCSTPQKSNRNTPLKVLTSSRNFKANEVEI